MRPVDVNFCPPNPRALRGTAVQNYRAFVVGIRASQCEASPDQFLLPEVQEFHRQNEDEWKSITNAQKIRDRDR